MRLTYSGDRVLNFWLGRHAAEENPDTLHLCRRRDPGCTPGEIKMEKLTPCRALAQGRRGVGSLETVERDNSRTTARVFRIRIACERVKGASRDTSVVPGRL